MQVSFKAIALVMASLASIQLVTAGEAINARELTEGIGQAFASGYIDAEIRSSCLIQTTAENREYVANEAECRDALNELLRVLSEGESLNDQIAQVKRFRAQYGI